MAAVVAAIFLYIIEDSMTPHNQILDDSKTERQYWTGLDVQPKSQKAKLR